MPSKLEVVPAAAGKRLGAAVLDWLPPVTVLTILLAVGFAGITRSQSGGFIVYDTSSLVLFGGIGAGLTLIYTRGPGHARRPLRRDPRQQPDGHPQHGCRRLRPGRRSRIPPRPHHRRRGAAGRDRRRRRGDVPVVRRGPAGAGTAPVPGGGLGCPRGALQRLGPQRPAPRLARYGRQDPRLRREGRTQPGHHRRHRRAPTASRRWTSRRSSRSLRRWPVPRAAAVVATAGCRRSAGRLPQRSRRRRSPFRSRRSSPFRSGVVRAACRPTFQPGPHPDDDHDRTQVRGDTHAPVTVAMLRIRLDDGRDIELDRTVLIGRNPAGHPGRTPCS